MNTEAINPTSKSMDMDISEIKFFITPNNMKHFTPFRSEIFYVRGCPWMVCLKYICNDLWLELISKVEEQPEDWTIFVTGSAKFIPTDVQGVSLEKQFPVHMLCQGHRSEIFFLDSLLLLRNDYVTNDTCKIEIVLKVSPVQYSTDNEWLKFESIPKCCVNSSNEKFRMTVKIFDGFMGVCSPAFRFDGYESRIILTRYVTDSLEDLIRIDFQLSVTTVDWTTKLQAILCTLITFDPNVKPLQKQAEGVDMHYLDFITWDELLKPSNRYIQNNSFVLEFMFKGKSVQCQECDEGAVKLMCSICFENLNNLSVSSLACGHMFCTECITKSIQQKKVCPICNHPATSNELRKTFLSL